MSLVTRLIPGLVLAALLAPAAERPPNFVILLVDDLGWADIGVHGSDLHRTPNIDRLASRSLRFTDAYAASPVCTPTRASIMTGKYPARLHMTVWHEASADPPRNRKLIPPVTRGSLAHEEVTIAEVLHQAGYFTAHLGKWHLGTAGYYPETQGFDVNIGGTFWGAPQSFFYPYRGTKHFDKNPRYIPGLHWGRHGEYLTDRLTDEALRVLDRAGDGPFFLNMCYHTVHTPIEAKPEVVDRYRDGAKKAEHHRNPTYAAMVDSLDESVGRILAKLDERGLADNTIVVFASDNGGYVNPFEGVQVTDNHPLRSGKGSLYEGGVRVPLLIRWPGVSRDGSVSEEPVSSIDFYPTMLEMAGLAGDASHKVDGLSLAPLLKDPSARLGRDALYFHYPHYYPTTTPVSSVREGDWKLLHYYEDNRVELFDLSSDPSESRDLASSQPGRARSLRRKLDAWRADVNAQTPAPNSRPSAAQSRPRQPRPPRNRSRMADTIKANVYADNWFKMYINGKLVAVDSIEFIPHNAISVDILPEYPMTIAVMAKDFADTKTGLEYNNTRIGDGGLILKLGDGTVSNAQWKAKKVFWGPLNGDIQNPKVVREPIPANWYAEEFDDGGWENATEFTVEQVRPQQPYRDHDFAGAKFIWSGDLDLDNTVLFRYRVEKPPAR